MHFVRFLCKAATKAVDSDVVEVTVVFEEGDEVDLFLVVKSAVLEIDVMSLLECNRESGGDVE